MWLNMLGKVVTVDEVSKATGLQVGYKYTTPAHLIIAAGLHGLKLIREYVISRQTVVKHIDAGRPLITLVHYGSLPHKSTSTFTAGHWIVIVGYGDNCILYNDPLWQTADEGAALVMSDAEFEKALSDCYIDGNTQRQGLVMA